MGIANDWPGNMANSASNTNAFMVNILFIEDNERLAWLGVKTVTC